MRERTGIQLCYPFEERRLLEAKFGWTFPVITQPKPDGERMRVICGREVLHKPILLSSTENIIISVPHIQEELRIIKEFIELDGELYHHGWDFDQINSVVSRTKNLHENFEQISYYIFDIISDEPQYKRTIQILSLFKEYNFKYLKMLSYNLCHSLPEIMKQYNEYIKQGYEGIIIRHIKSPYVRKRSRFIMKFKPKKTDIYKIIDIIEGSGDHKGMVGAFVCQGFDATQFRVSAGEFTHSNRKIIWNYRKNLIGEFLRISYQNLTKNQVPRFGIAKEIVDAVETETEYQGIL